MAYKLLKHEKDHYLIEHPDGSSFKVAKSGIGKDLHQRIMGLRKEDNPEKGYAEGTADVEEEDDTEAPGQAEPETNSDIATTQDLMAQAPTGSPLEVNVTPQEMAAAQGQQAAPAFQNAAFAPKKVSDTGPITPMTDAASQLPFYQEQERGVKAQVTSESEAAKKIAGYYSDYQKTLSDLDTQTIKNHTDNMAAITKLQQDVATKQVNPHQYWDNMNIGQRIGNAIAIALGGIGGAMTGHGGNVALDVINRNIENDIASQRSNIDQKNNSIRLLMEQGRTQQEAENQLRLNAYGVVMGQIQGEMAKSSDPNVNGRGLQLMGELHQNMFNSSLQYARMRAVAQMAAGGGGNVNPEFLDPQTRARAVNVPGRGLMLAPDQKAAETARTALAPMAPIFDKLDQLEQFSGKGVTRFLPNSPERNQINALRGDIASGIAKIKGRVSPATVDMYKKMLSDPASVFSTLENGQLTKQLKQSLMGDVDGVLSQNIEGYKSAPKIKSAQTIQ